MRRSTLVLSATMFLLPIACGKGNHNLGTTRPDAADGPISSGNGGNGGSVGIDGAMGNAGADGQLPPGVVGTGGGPGIDGAAGNAENGGSPSTDGATGGVATGGQPGTGGTASGSGGGGSNLDAGPDASIVLRDTGLDGISVPKDAAVDAASKDDAVVDGGPTACTGTLVPGNLPLPATGNRPISAASGDLNGDGKLDIVTANFDSATVSVLIGKGDGTFAAKVDYPTGNSPHSVVLGDLNGDGKQDLVVANDGSATVSVLIGKGDGTFAAKVDYPAGDRATSVALGDLNGDGRPDLIVANLIPTGSVFDPQTVSVLLGTGDGRFAAKVDYPTGGEPLSIALGDLNGDGKLDIVTANWYGPGDWHGSVSVLLGKGDGTLAANADYAAGDGTSSVALGDLNGDGKLDVVAANANEETVSVLLGTADGTFAAHVDYPTRVHAYSDGPWAVQRSMSPNSMVLGDVNGDGKLDIVDGATVLLGTADGTFAGKVDYPIGGDPTSVVMGAVLLGDFDGDHRADFATANFDMNTVRVLLGSCQ